MAGKGQKINYLTEDPIIPSQRYALLTIVGPNMKQKCDVWGMKIRGMSDTLEGAKELSKRIMKFDSDYDIYTVDVGKFFPLQVSPDQLKDVEYQNEQLNSLMKEYLDNKEKANELWHQRKNEMVKEAEKEGTKEFQEKIQEQLPEMVYKKITELEQELREQQEIFKSFSDEQKSLVYKNKESL